MDSQPPSPLEQGVVVRPYIRYLEKQSHPEARYIEESRQRADLKLNTQGYATYSEHPLDNDGYDFETFKCPEGLKSEAITPLVNGRGKQYFIWSPEMADVHIVWYGPKLRKGNPFIPNEEITQLENNGWEFVDGNVRYTIYVRTKINLAPTAVPSDISQNEELMNFLPRKVTHHA